MSTTENKDPSGAANPASGEGETEPKQKNTVQYETHLKLLNEKKSQQERALKLEEELKTLKQEKEERERKELEQQGNFKKLLEQERESKKSIEEKHNSLLHALEDSTKKSAVLRHIAGKVPDEVIGALLSVEGVALNEDGSVNDDTAKVVAQEFEKKFPYVVLREQKPGNLPNQAAASGVGQKLSYQEWLNLKDSKEMKKRYGDVDWTTA